MKRKSNETTANQSERTKDTQKETNNDVTRKKIENDKKIQERNEVQKTKLRNRKKK